MSGDAVGDGVPQELPGFVLRHEQNMLEPVRVTTGLALVEASEELQTDRDVVLAAVEKSGWSLSYASDELTADKEVVMTAVKQCGLALEYASNELKADQEVVMEAVQQDGTSLEYASNELQADKEVVMEAVKQDVRSLQFASNELKADKAFVMEAVKQGGTSLEYASNELQADKEVVIEAVKQGGASLQFASNELKTDKDLILLAARLCKSTQTGVLSRDLEAIWDQEGLSKTKESSIAVQGEDAPIVTISLYHEVNEAGEAVFSCEACLMSGRSINCIIEDSPKHDRWGRERPQPILDHLAWAFLAELRNQSQASTPERVFINFIIKSEDRNEDEDGEVVMPVTPWDWERPLSDFLAAPAPTPTQRAAT